MALRQTKNVTNAKTLNNQGGFIKIVLNGCFKSKEEIIVAEIRVPELAESITEGTIAQWVKKVGDRVEKGEFIVELETDKVNAEIISEEAGILTEI